MSAGHGLHLNHSKQEQDMDFEIESGIEKPPVRRRGDTRQSKYPFADMVANQSFYVDANGDPLRRVKARMNSAASQYSRRHGGKFSVREWPNGQPTGVRVFCDS